MEQELFIDYERANTRKMDLYGFHKITAIMVPVKCMDGTIWALRYEPPKTNFPEISQKYDPCSGRSCDECEIGGCDHGREVV